MRLIPGRSFLLAGLVLSLSLATTCPRAMADIVVPTVTESTFYTDLTYFNAANLSSNGGLSEPVNNGDSLAHALSVTMPATPETGSQFSNYWETISAGDANYFDAYGRPVLILDLGHDYALKNLVLWQNIVDPLNGNQAQAFALRYATDATGPNFSGKHDGFSLQSIPALGGVNSAQGFDISGVTARYVELTLTSNYYDTIGYGGGGVGGDRVGLGSIRVDAAPVPEPSSLAFFSVASLVGTLVVHSRRRSRSSGQ